ncbi:MAG TPA: hypothetical protein VKN35_09770 [Xanthomonadales bacterium]|nr:hypothetical protein [Xanthomonadales bacterium]
MKNPLSFNKPAAVLVSGLFMALALALTLTLTGCQGEQDAKAVDEGSSDSTAAAKGNSSVTVNMEGQDFELNTIDPINSKIELGAGSATVLLMQDDYPVQVNLNITDPEMLAAGQGVYSLPEDNAEEIKVDLNFFNTSRKGLSMNQRVVFKEGTINIEKLGPNRLKFTFTGKGHPLMDAKQFPIEGSVDVSF